MFNAGAFKRGPVHELSPAEFENVWKACLLAPFSVSSVSFSFSFRSSSIDFLSGSDVFSIGLTFVVILCAGLLLCRLLDGAGGPAGDVPQRKGKERDGERERSTAWEKEYSSDRTVCFLAGHDHLYRRDGRRSRVAQLLLPGCQQVGPAGPRPVARQGVRCFFSLRPLSRLRERLIRRGRKETKRRKRERARKEREEREAHVF